MDVMKAVQDVDITPVYSIPNVRNPANWLKGAQKVVDIVHKAEPHSFGTLSNKQ